MLVLSRKKNESIKINDDITIVVVEIRGDKVRLGIEAPKEVPVHRKEVYDAIRRSEAEAASRAAEAATQGNATGNGQQGRRVGEKSPQVGGNPYLMFPRSSLEQVG
jgi:carbon storage regulator